MTLASPVFQRLDILTQAVQLYAEHLMSMCQCSGYWGLTGMRWWGEKHRPDHICLKVLLVGFGFEPVLCKVT